MIQYETAVALRQACIDGQTTAQAQTEAYLAQIAKYDGVYHRSEERRVGTECL